MDSGFRLLVQRHTTVIGGYVEGLYTLTSISNRREFCEHLHQPQELLLGFMLIVTAGAGRRDFSSSLQDLVVQLAKICPTHTSWRDCNTALKAILVWTQTPNREISLFPWPPSLQSLCTTAAFRKYPLVYWIANRLSSPYVRKHWEVSLEMLHTILENAEGVEGVLIPDLQSRMRIVAAPESQVLAPAGDQLVACTVVAGPSFSG
ncbi:hypothetical protein BDZ89DRAFT_790297 [Hymenopellis radicata]|nr:hypothetical protein BDZ89DRAFT_790297 [Hymenopellis radicata]